MWLLIAGYLAIVAAPFVAKGIREHKAEQKSAQQVEGERHVNQ